MELDINDKQQLHQYKQKHLEVVAQREAYLLLRASPLVDYAHREIDSLVFAVFRDSQAAAAAAGRVKQGLDRILQDAVVAVADPDLGLGDFGVDVWGPEDQLSAAMQQRLEIAREQDFRMARRGVVPEDLSDEALLWLASDPAPRVPRIPASEASPSYFRLIRGSRDLGVVDCNGMKWRNAAVAVLRDGLLGAAMTEAQAAELLADVEWVRLPAEYEPTGNEAKAQKRARGTAPVSAMTQGRYHGLLQALKATSADYPLPDLDKDAKKVVDAMSAEYHRRKALGVLKPSDRQVQFAKDIAARLGLSLPFDPETASKAEIAAFIERNKGDAKTAGGRQLGTEP